MVEGAEVPARASLREEVLAVFPAERRFRRELRQFALGLLFFAFAPPARPEQPAAPPSRKDGRIV